MSIELTPLHVRSGYSLLRGTCTPARLAETARRIDYARIALTDVNSLSGATVFHKAAIEAGLKPITGAELSVAGKSAVALIESDCGYANLCRLITRIHRDDDTSDVFDNDLAEFSDGLHFIVEDPQLARHLCEQLNRKRLLNRERLWLGIDPATQRQTQIRELTDIAKQFDLPLVATGKALTTAADERDIAQLLTAIRTGATFDSIREDQLPHPNAYLREPKQWARQLKHFGEAVANNRRLGEMCSGFKLLPRSAVFPAFECPGGLSPEQYLRKLCRRGITRRYGDSPPASLEARLRRELSLIEAKGFSTYFLVVWDIVSYARSHSAPVAGRGSGASSLVAYLLGITNVCPLAYDIPFERFLNDQRQDFPDLDVDFCWRIRDDVIDYAFERFGRDRAAMVCTHNTFKARSAVRETAKAFGMSDEQISRIGQTHRSDDFAVKRIGELARRITHLPHVLSVHPGGIVLTPDEITRYAPIQRSAKGVMITQYDKNGVEDIGLVKLDLLGNRSLSTIRFACDLILRRHGEKLDVDTIPTDDAATIHMLQQAETVACNQLESPAMRHLLKAMKPAGIGDLMKALALIRPGAASIGMKDLFIRRHRGEIKTPTCHPMIDAILKNTHGVMLYEDDVMLIAAAISGSSLAEGDRFRRAVQKCSNDQQRLELSREFLARCKSAGMGESTAKTLWVQMAKFNAYSFCRAHAGSYAYLAWAVAYLKSHWPVEFYTAALNNNQSMYHPRVYVEQAKRRGIRFLPPDVNRSGLEFTLDGDSIRVGLNFIAGFGPVGAAAILSARAKRPFAGLSDMMVRTPLGEPELRSLILCGAADSFGPKRPMLMMELSLALQARSKLIANDPCLLPVELSVPGELDDYSLTRKLSDERKILGISIGEHVMVQYRRRMAGLTTADSRDLERSAGKHVTLAGVLEAVRTARTQRGEPMSFLTLDDEWGLFEVTVFPDARKRMRCKFDKYGPYIVSGKVEIQHDSVTLTAQSVSLWQPNKMRQ